MTETRMQIGSDHHPSWCALGDLCLDIDFPQHLGATTRWMPEQDDVQLTLELARFDDHRPDTGETFRGRTRTRLSLFDTGSVNLDETEIVARVDLTPADARRLASLLNRYADECEVDHPDMDRRDIHMDGLGGAA